ncbi:hypothetical protein [Thermocatellispora tengchongensis]|uniref:hypothetical protein n=1 Tax=Thermocatellispora tengchongensis TaxID=1073253 RepID=UPI003628C4DE
MRSTAGSNSIASACPSCRPAASSTAGTRASGSPRVSPSAAAATTAMPSQLAVKNAALE